MKRIFSLVLSFTLILSIFCVTYVNAADDKQMNEEYLSFLQKLGIIGTIDESVYNLNISREDFAYFVSRANKFSSDNRYDRRFYVDVSSDSYAFVEIQNLTNNGIISGDGSEKFRPKDEILYSEAIVMILNSMGYKDICLAKGGFPLGYTSVAKYLKLSNKNADDKLTYAEAVNLLYDALKTGICDIETISGDETKYVQNSESWIKTVFGIDFAEGSVEAVYGNTVYSDKIMDRKKILISGNEYTVDTDFDESDFIGEYVTFFYYETSESIIYIIPKEYSQSPLVVDIDDFIDIDGTTLNYYLGDNKKKTALEDEFSVIYNGMPLTNNYTETLNDLNNGKGELKIKDRNGNGRYDTVIIEDYKGVMIGSISYDNLTLYNKLDSKEKLDLSNAEYLSVFQGGKEIKFEDLVINSYVDIAQSVNKDSVKIRVADKTVNGKLTAVKNDVIEIDGRAYDIANDVLQSNDPQAFKKLLLGIEYLFYLDSYDKVAYVNTAAGKVMKYGYLIKAAAEYGVENTVRIKVFSEDGQMYIYDVSDKLKLDGISYKGEDPEEIAAYFKNTRQLIEYKLNSKNEIEYIDTAIVINDFEDSSYSLRPIYKEGSKQWYQAGRFGINALLSTATVCFYIPEEDDSEDSCYSVGNYYKAFSYEVVGDADVYYKSDDSSFIDVMVKKVSINEKKENADAVFMVEKSEELLNEENENIYEISGFNGYGQNVKVQIDVDKSDGKYSKGDIVIGWKSDVGNEYIEIEKIFDASEDEYPQSFYNNEYGSLLYKDSGAKYGNNPGYYSETQISFGYVSRVFEDGVIAWGIENNGEESERAISKNLTFPVYDSKSDTITIGTEELIKDYATTKNECSKIFYYTNKGLYQGMFIIN